MKFKVCFYGYVHLLKIPFSPHEKMLLILYKRFFVETHDRIFLSMFQNFCYIGLYYMMVNASFKGKSTVGVETLNFVLLMDVTFQNFSSFAIIQSHPIIQLLNQR